MGRAHNIILDRGVIFSVLYKYSHLFSQFFFLFVFQQFSSCLSSVQEESDTCSLTSTLKNFSISLSFVWILQLDRSASLIPMAPFPNPSSVGGGGTKRDEATTKATKKKEEDLVLSI